MIITFVVLSTQSAAQRLDKDLKDDNCSYCSLSTIAVPYRQLSHDRVLAVIDKRNSCIDAIDRGLP